MTVKENLIAARAKIADPDHWTQGTYARDSTKVAVSPLGPHATCWCATGALLTLGLDSFKFNDVIEALIKALPAESVGNVPRYNDNHSHAEVLAVFDKAIEEAS